MNSISSFVSDLYRIKQQYEQFICWLIFTLAHRIHQIKERCVNNNTACPSRTTHDHIFISICIYKFVSFVYCARYPMRTGWGCTMNISFWAEFMFTFIIHITLFIVFENNLTRCLTYITCKRFDVDRIDVVIGET